MGMCQQKYKLPDDMKAGMEMMARFFGASFHLKRSGDICNRD